MWELLVSRHSLFFFFWIDFRALVRAPKSSSTFPFAAPTTASLVCEFSPVRATPSAPGAVDTAIQLAYFVEPRVALV
jgi:hypothetical protein